MDNESDDLSHKIFRTVEIALKSNDIRIHSLHYQLKALVDTIFGQLMQMETDPARKVALGCALVKSASRNYQKLLELHEDIDPEVAAELEKHPPIFNALLNRYAALSET